MSRVVLTGVISVPANVLADVLKELPNHIRLSREEAGCLVFNVTQDASCQQRFDVYEVFKDKASFDAHQQRVRQSRWGGLTRHAERNYTLDFV